MSKRNEFSSWNMGERVETAAEVLGHLDAITKPAAPAAPRAELSEARKAIGGRTMWVAMTARGTLGTVTDMTDCELGYLARDMAGEETWNHATKEDALASLVK